MATADSGGKPTRSTKSRRKGSDKKHPRLRALVKWTLITGAFLTVLGVAVAYIIYRNVDIPDANEEFQTETTNVYYSNGDSKIGKFETQNRTSVEIDDVPQSMQDAMIAAEDRTFYSNRGIDFKGIIRAARNNATTERTQGASTITQQYVKVLYLTQERSLKRKAREAVLSLKIHNQLSKEEILEGYLNTIYFGNGSYGIESASRAYFKKPASELDTNESAMLAAVINSPGGMDPFGSDQTRERLLNRHDYVLRGMVDAGNLDASEAAALEGKLPKFADQERPSRYGGVKGYLLRLTEKQLRKEGFTDAQINGGGLQVTTTFNRKAQAAMIDAIKENEPDGLKQLHIAATSVQPGTGAVRAMYGGPDYLEGQLNWATSGAQPGSTFKVFALAAALRNGYSLNTGLDGNSPITVPGGQVANQGDSGGRSYGRISLRNATKNSVNTAFVDLTMQMQNGPEKIRVAARDAGIPLDVVKRIPSVPVTALGVEPVPVVDMANAYATFANKGKSADWYVVSSVKDKQGRELFNHKVKEKKAFSSDVAADVTSALQGVTSGDGTGVNGKTICPTAGKTGTATAETKPGAGQHVSSSWFAGYTPKIATAVMYVRGKNGNADLEGYLPTFFGGQYPARTFASIMDGQLEGQKCGSFPPAANIRGTKGNTYVPPTTQAPQPEPTRKPEKPEKTKKTEKTPSKEPTTAETTPPEETSEPTTKTPPSPSPPTGGPDLPNGNN